MVLGLDMVTLPLQFSIVNDLYIKNFRGRVYNVISFYICTFEGLTT